MTYLIEFPLHNGTMCMMDYSQKHKFGTIAGEGLGQSVLIDVFRQIISAIKPNQKSKSNSLEMFF